MPAALRPDWPQPMPSPSPSARADPVVQRPTGRGLTALALAVIVLAGLALRFYRLGDVPGGLYQDEAYNGLDALDVLAGSHPLYFPANNGREPLYIYLVAASVGVLGRTPLAVRLPAAVLGTLTIPATFALGSALFTRRVGLLAAAACAATFWPVALSRIGLRAGGLPLFMAFSLACAAYGWRAMPAQRRHLSLLALGGALYGVTFYTYLAARFTPLTLSAFLIFWYSAKRKTFPNIRELGAFVVPAALVLLPLGLAALREPAILFGRAGQVSILNPAVNHGSLVGTLFHNLWAAVGMFFWRGDGIARHNLPGRPVFDLPLALAFLGGAVAAGRAVLARRHLPSALLLAWVGVMLAPTVLAEDAPHFLRAVGVLPAIFLIAAGGLEAVWRAGTAGRYRLASQALVIAVLSGSWLWTARDYFGPYAHSPTTAFLFQSAARDLAQLARRGLDGDQGAGEVYVDRRFWDDFASIRFLLPEQPRLHWFAEGQALAPTTAAGRTTVIVWPYEPFQAALAALPAGRLIRPESGPLYRGDLEPAPYSLYSAYTAEVLPANLNGQQPAARFEGGFTLLSFAAQPAAGAARVELIWQAASAPPTEFQVFAQAYAGGDLVAQADGPLGTALYPDLWWRPGDAVLETRDFPLPAGSEWSSVTVRIGLYDLATRIRLQRLDAPGDSVEFSLTNGR